MIHHRLIADLGDEQFHPQTALAGAGDSQQQALVWNEIRRDDDDPLLRRVEQAHEQLQVVLELEARPRRHDLGVEAADVSADVEVAFGIAEDLVGLAVPVAEEDAVDRGHHRPFQAHHQIDPVQAAANVLSQVVAGVGQVLRAGEGHPAVDHQQLAVVAQVRTLVFPLEGLQGEHELPGRAHRVQPGQGLLVVGLAAICPVIKQNADADTALDGLLQCLEEGLGRLIGLKNVELDVDVGVGLADGLRHRLDALLIVREQLCGVAAGQRHCAEIPVQSHHRLEPFRCRRLGAAHHLALGGLADIGIDFVLLAPASERQLRITDQQEQKQPDLRDEKDGQQPGHCRSWAAIARNDDQGGHTDHGFHDREHDGEPGQVDRYVHRQPPTVRLT